MAVSFTLGHLISSTCLHVNDSECESKRWRLLTYLIPSGWQGTKGRVTEASQWMLFSCVLFLTSLLNSESPWIPRKAQHPKPPSPEIAIIHEGKAILWSIILSREPPCPSPECSRDFRLPYMNTTEAIISWTTSTKTLNYTHLLPLFKSNVLISGPKADLGLLAIPLPVWCCLKAPLCS